ncbi:MAG: 4,5-DOPA dioxygenase extradiol [Marinoscillum sp.]|uniref:4,5-DOPA-extradiol-dioxygenase n=1 Tax=Marinoscillum sp. TaxID=2024838 RepID=UPI0032F9D8E2
MSPLKSFAQMTNDLPVQDKKMPVLFMGHGSPMNGIEDNEFTRKWESIAKEITQPAAVLCISAHWLTRGTHVTAMNHPKTIHDFGGFPQELFQVQYPAPGDPALAAETSKLIQSTNVGLDHDWGLDHGCWSVVKRMYPEANIPVLQLSIDYHQPPAYHYQLAQELSTLRKKGVLILGSGNMVHNLRMVDWQHFDVPNYGFDWAQEINEKFKTNIYSKEHSKLINYTDLGPAAKLAIPTPDHYYPLLYALGLQDQREEVEIFNDQYVAGSLTMTSVKIG